jgi:phosphinothricin acetyltransferase
MIRPATPLDSTAIARIYNHYILNSHATFEELPVGTTEIAMRINQVLDDHLPWLVLEDNGILLGFSRAIKWRERSAYRFSVESSIYIDPEHTGQGLGVILYTGLIEQLKTLGVHAVIGGVALPNPASVALHEKMGYKKVAHFKEVGWKFERWIDVGYWELILTSVSL